MKVNISIVWDGTLCTDLPKYNVTRSIRLHVHLNQSLCDDRTKMMSHVLFIWYWFKKFVIIYNVFVKMMDDDYAYFSSLAVCKKLYPAQASKDLAPNICTFILFSLNCYLTSLLGHQCNRKYYLSATLTLNWWNIYFNIASFNIKTSVSCTYLSIVI